MKFSSIRNSIAEKLYNNMPLYADRLSFNNQELKKFQTNRLKKILKLAREKTTWYKTSLKDINLETFTLDDLKKTPPTSKEIIMQNWDCFLTTSKFNKQDAETHLNNLRENSNLNPYYDDNYLFIATGGSSGNRGLFVWDKNFIEETVAITFRDLYKQDDMQKKCIVIIEAPTYLHGSKNLFAQHFAEHIDTISLDVTQNISTICSKLNEIQPKYIVGYPSTINEIAKKQLNNEINISPTWISTNSEELTENTRANCIKAWGVNPNNSWGSVEIGCVAMETNKHDGIVIAEDSVIIELVDNDFNPATEKNPATKLLATCLYNHTMPIIRYVIEDTVELKESNLKYQAYRAIKNIVGRTSDWFEYGNIKIPAMAFKDILSCQKEINEYQVIQTEKGAKIHLKCDINFDPKAITALISKNLVSCGLNKPEIDIKIVKSIPKHIETGKVRRFITLN